MGETRHRCTNRRKVSLRAHLIMVVKHRRPLLQGAVEEAVKTKVLELAAREGWDVLAMESDRDHLHLLLDHDAGERVCDVVKILRQEAAFDLWQRFPTFLRSHFWKKRAFWSDGHFACSVGEASQETVRRHIENQGRAASGPALGAAHSSHGLKAVGGMRRAMNQRHLELVDLSPMSEVYNPYGGGAHE